MGRTQRVSPGLALSTMGLALLSLVLDPLLKAWALSWIDSTYGVIGLTFNQWFGASVIVGILQMQQTLTLKTAGAPDSMVEAGQKIIGAWIAYPLTVGASWVWAHALGVL